MHRRRRRKHRRNPTSDRSLKAIAWTVGITALTAAVGAVVVYYVNKKLQPAPAKPALEVSGQWPDTVKQWLNQPGTKVA